MGAAEYLAEQYPPNVMNNPEIFIPVEDTAADKYGALNNGTCDHLIDWRNSYDIVKHQKDYNPACQLIQEGRPIKRIGLTFATMLDPGQKCTLLLKEVFNYYIKQMHQNGKLEELWQAHISSQSDPGHCDSTYGDNTQRKPAKGGDSDHDGTEDDAAATRRRLRSLKGGGAKGNAAATAGSVVSLEEENVVDSEEVGLNMMDMAGIFLLQVMGALVAILFTVLSYLENKYLRQKKAVPVTRESMRQSQLLEQHQQHPPTTHNNKDDTVDDDNDECYWHVDASTRLPRRPSFNSKKNDDDDKDREREQQEYSSRQREHQALGRVQKRLHHLQASHEELQQQYDGLKQQNETIISLLEN